MIRVATTADIPRILELGHLLHATTSYSAKAIVPEKVAAFLEALISGDHGVIFLAEQGGEVVGGLMGGLTDQWFNHDLIAYDYSFFLVPGHGFSAVKLMRAFELWAKARGASEIYMGIGTRVGVDGTVRLYESMGFEHFGPMLVKGVQ